MKLNQALENFLSDTLYDSFSNGELRIYGDSLIVTINLPSPAYKPAVKGTKTVFGTWQGTASASGTASTCRFSSADGVRVLEGSVTKKGGGGDVELDSVNIEAGQSVTITDGSGGISGG